MMHAEHLSTYEIVLSNGKIVDGCGNPWFWGDLSIQDGRIAEIGRRGSLHGDQVIDVQGYFITPGFIDIHTHSDLSILINRPAESAIRQGATTHIIGNCGLSPAPVDDAHFEEVHSWWEPEANMLGVSWVWRDFESYLDTTELGPNDQYMRLTVGFPTGKSSHPMTRKSGGRRPE